MMDEIDFDVDKIDAFAKSVFNSEKSSDTKVKLEGMNPELATRLEKAKYAYKEKYGKDLPVESGVRSREEQQHLYNRWESGDKSVYMPLNPDEHPDKEVFHTNAVDISSSVPEEFLNQFGIHRPLGNRDPVHAELMPNFKSDVITSQKPTNSPEPQDENNIDFNVDKIEEFAKDVQSSPPPPKKSEILGGGLLRGIASVADTAYGVVPGVAGMVGYAGARATGQTPQEAKQTETKISSFLDNPVGKAFGITETPEYKGEASRRLVNFIGENVDKGADWISEKTKLPKEDVEFYLNAAMMAAPGLKDTAVGKAVGREAGYIAGAAKDAVRSVGDTVAPVIPNSIKKSGASLKEIASRQFEKPVEAENVPRLTINSAEEGTQVTGGLPIQNEKTNLNFNPTEPQTPQTIKAALEKASPELRDSHKNIPDEQLNVKAVGRRLDGDLLPVKIGYMKGQALQDGDIISRERNNPKNADIYQNQNKKLVENIEKIKKDTIPNLVPKDKIDVMEHLESKNLEYDSNLSKGVTAKYETLKDAIQKSGGELLVDQNALKRNIDKALAKESLRAVGEDLSQYKELQRLVKDGRMDFDNYKTMRSRLAKIIRDPKKDGELRYSAGIMMKELDQLPLSTDVAAVKPLLDDAAATAQKRFKIIESDPFLEASIEGKVPSNKMFEKFIINAPYKDVATVIERYGENSVEHKYIKSAVIDWLSKQAGLKETGGNFKQSSYNTALENISKSKILQTIFDAREVSTLKRLGRVAFDLENQPPGNFVNNSKTFVASEAVKEADSLATKGPTKYTLSKVANFIDKYSDGKLRKASLAPNAGSSLKDIRNLGKK